MRAGRQVLTEMYDPGYTIIVGSALCVCSGADELPWHACKQIVVAVLACAVTASRRVVGETSGCVCM
jgi:hypothetical protein